MIRFLIYLILFFILFRLFMKYVVPGLLRLLMKEAARQKVKKDKDKKDGEFIDYEEVD